MTSLESSLLDMHVAQEQHYVGGILRWKRFLQKVFLALWCLFCHKKVLHDQPHNAMYM